MYSDMLARIPFPPHTRPLLLPLLGGGVELKSMLGTSSEHLPAPASGPPLLRKPRAKAQMARRVLPSLRRLV